MIFATDLDRTLIYSKIFIENFKEEYEQVEIYKERPISYITKQAKGLLKQLKHKAHVIPITTRNYEQYQRISLFKGELEPEIYVINNGGTIYYKGKKDMAWDLVIKEKMENLKWNDVAVITYFLQKYTAYIESYRKSDGLLWLILGDRNKMQLDLLQEIKNKIKDYGWKLDVNGRKIYLYPQFLTKWSALLYIQKKYYKEMICTCGDSLFDQEMLTLADYAMIPKDAYIEPVAAKHILRSEHKGIKAAEDMLNYAIKLAEKNMFRSNLK